MAQLSSYAGKPTLQLGDGRFPFTFGLAKAKLILADLDAIRAFVESGGKSCGAAVPAAPAMDAANEQAGERPPADDGSIPF